MSRTYFTDRDLGRAFPQILRDAGLTVEAFDDHFGPETGDEHWLKTIGRRGWIALSHDKQIRYKPTERNAVMRHGVALLLLIGKAPQPRLAQTFVATRDRIERFLDHETPPFIAKVSRPSSADLARNPAAAGSVTLWLSHAEWKRGCHR